MKLPRFVTSLVLLTSLLPPLMSGAAAPRPPNVVVILTDDQGYADISFNPHHPKEVSTPHLDALAREGVWFRQGYITGNVCSPTRAGLLTGRYQQRAGVYTAGEGGSGMDSSVAVGMTTLTSRRRTPTSGRCIATAGKSRTRAT
jgi:arylsulfatase A-like enzyme